MNQKLLDPSYTLTCGLKLEPFTPVEVLRHTRDVAIHTKTESEHYCTMGSLSYLVEDSWPRTYIWLGWNRGAEGLKVVLGIVSEHMDYKTLLDKERSSILLQVISSSKGNTIFSYKTMY